jgi:hypothetical protein
MRSQLRCRRTTSYSLGPKVPSARVLSHNLGGPAIAGHTAGHTAGHNDDDDCLCPAEARARARSAANGPDWRRGKYQ